ncbi:MAG: ATP-binding cassette domain-containing protein [Actinomycetota bacterium]|nr:ATP-binding cassette domain-containing protein [Actinomycetota bacterium]MDQ3575705.1 ATP-binding cassette domain-containing protein [Actinomycetota bacterium]
MQIVLTDVTKRYRADQDPAVAGVSLTAQTGERVSVIGPSGAGKTTLFRLLTRSLAPDSGSVRVGGSELGHASQRELRRLRRRMGVIHQRGDLVPVSSALLNVAAGAVRGTGTAALRLSLRGPSADITRRAFEALEEVEIASLAYSRVEELSGGQRQRVAVARLLVARPELIMADEPTASVDPRSAGIVLGALERLAAAGATLVLATHDLSIARRHHRVLALQKGRLAFSGRPEQLVPEVVEQVYAADTPAGQALRSPPVRARGCR